MRNVPSIRRCLGIARGARPNILKNEQSHEPEKAIEEKRKRDQKLERKTYIQLT